MSRFLQFLALSVLMMRSATEDPCDSPGLLGNLLERIVGYTSDDDSFIGDYLLTTAWYKLPPGYTLATSPEPCGTVFNWWTNGTLPSSGSGIINVCLKLHADNCAYIKEINVTLCTEGYVYKLSPTFGDTDAYCIEGEGQLHPDAAPDISSLEPIISSHVNMRPSSLEFYCELDIQADTSYADLFYDFEWNLFSGASKLISLHFVENVQFNGNETDFHERTKLTEVHLKSKGITKPGFTIICSVKARNSSFGYDSHIITSDPKFFGIKILTPSPIRIVQGETQEIQFELTVPFGCSINGCSMSLHIVQEIQEEETCTLSNLVQRHPDDGLPEGGRPCIIAFENVGDIATFMVTAEFGNNQQTQTSRAYDLLFSTPLVSLNHPFFEGYILPSIRVELLVNQQILQNKLCYSVGDPHFQTFDGRRFSQYSNANFILYRHKTLEAEVQTKTTFCDFHFSHRKCNCGVTVRAGGDIFQINNCDGTIPPRIVQCKDGVLQKKIKRVHNTYEIQFPHGTKVIIKIRWRNFIDVHIYPSLEDLYNTEGLCGYFDGNSNTENEYIRRDGTTEKFDDDSWKVMGSEDLFNPENHATKESWSQNVSFCKCSHNNKSYNTTCSDAKKCLNDIGNIRDAICDYQTKRKKRDVSGFLLDWYTDPTTAFKSSFAQDNTLIGSDIYLEEHPRHKRQTTYTNETALAACLTMMNTTVFQMCESLPGLDIDGFINSCVLDALASGSMDWTMQYLENIKQTCIDYVEVMQPLPQKILDLLVVLPDINSTDYYNETYEYQPLPPQNESSVSDPITTELFQELLEMICSNECSGNGICINGVCHCDEPYINFDCSINKAEPPIMLGIPDRGECDLQNRPCAETSVFGQNIAEIDTLTCRTTYFTIDRNNDINIGQSVDVPGYYESMNEIICPMPISTRERTVDQLDGVMAYGYQILFSNDGTAFSEADTIVIYDSLCVNCTKVGEDIVCTTKDGYCLNGGRCYVPGMTLGCYTCSDDDWMTGPDCPSDDDNEVLKGWMIGVICASVVVVVIIIIIVTIVCLCGKSRSNKKIGVYMDSLDVNTDFNSCKKFQGFVMNNNDL